MQTNQPSNLSSKQKELVNRLEKIRQDRQNENKPRNKDVQQRNRQRKKNVERTTTREINKEFKKVQTIKPKKVKSSHKKTSSIAKGLKNGNDLAQAMVLSEILSKPVALRKHKR